MPKKKLYTLLPEHKARFPEWRDRWIANALSTKPMDDEERRIVRDAVKGLYRAANLDPPPDNRIVFVPSPFVGAFAAGFAAWIWWMREHKRSAATDDATGAATDAATRAATLAATLDATTDDATDAATLAATLAATGAATRAATLDATLDATDAATGAATLDATDAATGDATDDATLAATGAATVDATLDATRAATLDATRAATLDATRAATRAATLDATRAATDDATRAATDDVTLDVTGAATDDATGDATRAATLAATGAATDDGSRWWALGDCDTKAIGNLAGRLFPGQKKQMLECAWATWKMRNGGNQWSGWCAFLTFFRYIALLDLDYSKWDHYEQAAIHAGPRWMYSKFCIVSDRPSELKIDENNKPHCDSGPFCTWRDGSKLYSIHGVRVSGLVVEQPHLITAEMIEEEQNDGARQVMLERCPPAEAAVYTIRHMKAAG